jgi:hypothetical protein
MSTLNKNRIFRDSKRGWNTALLSTRPYLMLTTTARSNLEMLNRSSSCSRIRNRDWSLAQLQSRNGVIWRGNILRLSSRSTRTPFRDRRCRFSRWSRVSSMRRKITRCFIMDWRSLSLKRRNSKATLLKLSTKWGTRKRRSRDKKLPTRLLSSELKIWRWISQASKKLFKTLTRSLPLPKKKIMGSSLISNRSGTRFQPQKSLNAQKPLRKQPSNKDWKSSYLV